MLTHKQHALFVAIPNVFPLQQTKQVQFIFYMVSNE